jgi:XTP/dITP diphosphohydrolase
MNSIILATQNSHKKQKLQWIVKGYFKKVIKMPGKLEVEENGETFEENAQIKAVAAAKKFHNYAIATDGGALIPALGGKWNALLTRRFVGKKEVSDWDRIDTLLEMMKNLKGAERKVEWREAVTIANPSGKVIYSVEVEGDTGLIQENYRKDQYREGIWLCTLTCYPQFGGKNFFELNQEEQKAGEISWWRLKEKVTRYLKGLDISA